MTLADTGGRGRTWVQYNDSNPYGILSAVAAKYFSRSEEEKAVEEETPDYSRMSKHRQDGTKRGTEAVAMWPQGQKGHKAMWPHGHMAMWSLGPAEFSAMMSFGAPRGAILAPLWTLLEALGTHFWPL